MTYKPDFLILHSGTNDLKHNDDSEDIAKNIIDLAVEISNTHTETTVAISGLLPRNDRFKLQASNVNKHLKQMCSGRNIGFIDNSNLDPQAHLNRSRLHPNKKGTEILTRNLHLFIKN